MNPRAHYGVVPSFRSIMFVDFALPARKMKVTQLLLLSALVATTACSEGTPCGGTRSVDAQAVLPDTGLGASGKASVSFTESEPNRPDYTSLIVWTFPAANMTFTDGPPRVRLVADDGRVFLDAESSLAYQGSWYAKTAIPDGVIRDEIVAAFRANQVTVEFQSVQSGQRLTRVRPTVQFAGKQPVYQCI